MLLSEFQWQYHEIFLCFVKITGTLPQELPERHVLQWIGSELEVNISKVTILM